MNYSNSSYLGKCNIYIDLSNYYKSKNQEQKAKEYTRKVDGFEGYVYPLKRTDINEF